MENHIDDIIEFMKSLNGMTKKNSEKIIFDLISNREKINEFKNTLTNLENFIEECKTCFYFKYKNYCESCDNEKRSKNKICVVSTIQDAKTIIDKEIYNGQFHILKGEININKASNPDKLTLSKLFDKINLGDEVLLALNTTFEGEVTSNYIANELSNKKVKVSRLAKGLPFGGVIDYIDKETLKSAFEHRKDIKE